MRFYCTTSTNYTCALLYDKEDVPFPKQQILGSCKLKEFADDNSKYDENGEKFSKWVENAAWKGEIARYEQFLLFPLRFQKTCTADTLKPGLVWERVNLSAKSIDQCHSAQSAQVGLCRNCLRTMNCPHFSNHPSQPLRSPARPCSFRRLMIVIVTGFIPLLPLSIDSEMVLWESS